MNPGRWTLCVSHCVVAAALFVDRVCIYIRIWQKLASHGQHEPLAGGDGARRDEAREEDGAADEKGLKVKLVRLPRGEPGAEVPSSRAWSHWVNMRLRPWASAQREGFADIISETLRGLRKPVAPRSCTPSRVSPSSSPASQSPRRPRAARRARGVHRPAETGHQTRGKMKQKTQLTASTRQGRGGGRGGDAGAERVIGVAPRRVAPRGSSERRGGRRLVAWAAIGPLLCLY